MQYLPHVFTPNSNRNYKHACAYCNRVIDHPIHVQAVAFVPDAVIRSQRYQREHSERWRKEDER
jgi:hypothetical protein